MFLSIDVDDFRLAGKRQHIAPMWKALNRKSDLDPPRKLDGCVYLGVRQHEVAPHDDLVQEKLA
eukprot:7799549-Karenia_brevis.AAC.1